GLAVVVLAYVAARKIGYEHLDLVLLLAGVTGILIALLLVVSTGVGGILMHAALKRAETRQKLELEAETSQMTGFCLQFPRWIPLIETTWQWERPEGGRDRVEVRCEWDQEFLVEKARPMHRAVYKDLCRRVSVRDVLGLNAFTWNSSREADILVLPHRGRLDNLEVLNSLIWGDDISDPRGEPIGDRVDMRQYAHGDSPRMILWKLYARTRKLMVRIPERAITTRPRACAYQLAGEDTEPVAGLARVILERGVLGEGWRFGADGTAGHTPHLQEALRLLAASGNTSAEPGSGLGQFLQQAQLDGYASCFLFLPSRPGPWMARVVAALERTRMQVTIFLGTDELRVQSVQEPWWHRVLFRQEHDPNRPRSEDLSQVTQTFGKLAAEMILVDRQAGRLYRDPRHLLGSRA
ncbi:MAG: DUF58 domain-containing protein, partial [Candidatus Xenobia bacterium]